MGHAATRARCREVTPLGASALRQMRHRWATEIGARKDAARWLDGGTCFSICRDAGGWFWLDCAHAVLMGAELARYEVVIFRATTKTVRL
jgi:hypothetical protein